MININNTELQVAKGIVNTGLQKAAESLSFFMKEKITLDEMDYNFSKSPNPEEFTSKTGNNIHLLTTEIIGELKGICCLIFSEDEANKLRHTALPPEITSNPEIMAEMSDGILLEVDNIISASVITQFSNILKHKIHGGVPNLKKMHSIQINQFIKEKLEQDMLIVNFNIHFASPNLDFSPQFIWLFDNSFSQSIQNFAADKNNIDSLIK